MRKSIRSRLMTFSICLGGRDEALAWRTRSTSSSQVTRRVAMLEAILRILI